MRYLMREQWLCVVNAAPCEITHMMEITADYRPALLTRFALNIACDISCRPNSGCLLFSETVLSVVSKLNTVSQAGI